MKSPRSKRIAVLDRVFSEFIRKRDTPGRCISCQSLITYSNSDCGHYVNRKHMSLRYDETNCNAQCRACNRFDEGNIQGYRRGLIKKYGEEATDMLEIRKHNECRLSVVEIDILINYYKKKIKEL
jgi:hypothetical protein